MPTIRDLSYGRSEAGREDVFRVYLSWIQSYQRCVRGEEYQKVLSAIQNGWIGADADAFIKKLKEIATQLEYRVNRYCLLMTDALRSDASSFAKLQNNNQNNVNTINTRF